MYLVQKAKCSMSHLHLTRSLAILSYLARQGSASYGELAQVFQLTPLQVHKIVRQLFLVEPPQGANNSWVVDLQYDEEVTPENMVYYGSAEVPTKVGLQISEVFLLLTLIDLLSKIATLEVQHQLQLVKADLQQAMQTNGFDHLWQHWQMPTVFANTTAVIDKAFTLSKELQFKYWQAGTNLTPVTQNIQGIPLALIASYKPLLMLGDKEKGSVNYYRLDRIADIALSSRNFSKRQQTRLLNQVKDSSWGSDLTKCVLHCTSKAQWLAEAGIAQTTETKENTWSFALQVRYSAWLRALLLELNLELISAEIGDFTTELIADLELLLAHYTDN